MPQQAHRLARPGCAVASSLVACTSLLALRLCCCVCLSRCTASTAQALASPFREQLRGPLAPEYELLKQVRG